MKTYEKYLLTEKMTATKMLKKIENHFLNATTSAEVHVGAKMMISFMKKYKSLWTDEVSTRVTDLFRAAKKRNTDQSW